MKNFLRKTFAAAFAVIVAAGTVPAFTGNRFLPLPAITVSAAESSDITWDNAFIADIDTAVYGNRRNGISVSCSGSSSWKGFNVISAGSSDSIVFRSNTGNITGIRLNTYFGVSGTILSAGWSLDGNDLVWKGTASDTVVLSGNSLSFSVKNAVFTVGENYGQYPAFTVSPVGAGTVSVTPKGNGVWVYTAVPNEGFEFDSWSYTASSTHTSSNASITVTDLFTDIKANFKEAGKEFTAGDTFDITGKWCFFDDKNDTVVFLAGGAVRVASPTYDSRTSQWCFSDLISYTKFKNSLGINNAAVSPAYSSAYMSVPDGRSPIDIPSGFRISEGSGTQEDPYKFSLVYNSGRKSSDGTASAQKWGEWEIIVEPTYTSKGLKRRVCLDDPSQVETEELPVKTPVYYTVSFDSAGGSYVSSQTVRDGLTGYEPEKPSKQGYVFAGWLLNGNAYSFSTPVTSNITLTAKWENSVEYDETWQILRFTGRFGISYNLDGGVNSPDNPGFYYRGKGTPLAPAYKTGCVFEGWYLDSTFTQPLSEISDTQSGKVILYAKFTPEGGVKPSVTVSVPSYGKVRLKWNKVSGASIYKIFVIKDGELKELRTVSRTSIVINGKKAADYPYAVSALVNGEWTEITPDDFVSAE